MQRLIQRTEHAQRMATRRAEKALRSKQREERWSRRQSKIRLNSATLRLQKEARNNRKIDWDAGPLAPRREVGEKALTFGTTHVYDISLPDAEPEHRPKWVHVDVGDRVVVTRGRAKGQIGAILDVDLEKAAVKVKDVNTVAVHMPEWLRRENGSDQEISTTERFIPLTDVKLVYALPDPTTGVYRDTIIEEVHCVGRTFDKDTRKWDQGHRVIPHMNVIIPWPEKGEPEDADNAADTVRYSVDAKTFRPFLLAPPMPLSVIDELRNKYSKFRTEHDYDFIAKKEMEDAKAEERKSLVKTMRTPLQELAELRAKERRTQGLTQDQLAKIGEVIAQEKVKATRDVRDR